MGVFSGKGVVRGRRGQLLECTVAVSMTGLTLRGLTGQGVYLREVPPISLHNFMGCAVLRTVAISVLGTVCAGEVGGVERCPRLVCTTL